MAVWPLSLRFLFSMKYYQQIIAGIALVAMSIFVLIKGTEHIIEGQRDSNAYSGPHWKHVGETMESSEIFNSKYLRLESHTIRTSKGELVNGWMWVDFHDQVNVLAQDMQGIFHLIRQTKYGISKPCLSVVSGFIALNEKPQDAAARELLDELGMVSDEWTFLGKYRTDANRGGGFVHTFLAAKSRPAESNRLPSNEMEKQEIVQLPLHQLTSAVLRGDFAEAKWSNTVAIALLRMLTPGAPSPPNTGDVPLNHKE